ncbi:H-NS family nucleoid-associated regulatory protein [Paraburkholderia sediminicola]|uniref:H-NS family nucleoid-associated regulatory protein n=1 Tax=Paraburkholderia rhynchosiae TaxID=487049 RepID=A0ACC7N4R3_9BURK
MSTLEQIQAKLKKLQAQADALIARKAQVAVDQIRELMLKHGLTTEDIEAKAKASRVARGLNGHAGAGKSKSIGPAKVAKYRDHKTGATWTGHGRAPGWIAGVKDRTQFLIHGASELKSEAKAVLTRVKRAKGQPKGAQPPKYLNPKTGATWSGRGPAPAWLATVKDRTKFLIDGATAASKVASKAASKAGKAKSAATSGAVSKKAAAKKVVAKKAAAAKKTAAKKATAATRKVAARKGAAKPAAKKITAKNPAGKAPRKAPARKAAAKTVANSAPAAPQAAPVEASA